MSDLEDLGLVSSLHTSSGRVPTVSGYRLFLDTLLTVRPPAETEVGTRCAGALPPGTTPRP